MLMQLLVLANLELEITTFPNCTTMEVGVEKNFVMVQKNLQEFFFVTKE